MSAVQAIAHVQVALSVLKEQIPPWKWSETPLPVIAAPGWWMREVARELGVGEENEPAEIHGCSVVRNDDIPEPVLVDWNGKTFSILPKWAKAQESTA